MQDRDDNSVIIMTALGLIQSHHGDSQKPPKKTRSMRKRAAQWYHKAKARATLAEDRQQPPMMIYVRKIQPFYTPMTFSPSQLMSGLLRRHVRCRAEVALLLHVR